MSEDGRRELTLAGLGLKVESGQVMFVGEVEEGTQALREGWEMARWMLDVLSGTEIGDGEEEGT